MFYYVRTRQMTPQEGHYLGPKCLQDAWRLPWDAANNVYPRSNRGVH